MKKSTIIIIGVIVIAVLWCISAYNGMVTKQEGATTALADVQATYQRRADLLPNLTKRRQNPKVLHLHRHQHRPIRRQWLLQLLLHFTIKTKIRGK